MADMADMGDARYGLSPLEEFSLQNHRFFISMDIYGMLLEGNHQDFDTSLDQTWRVGC